MQLVAFPHLAQPLTVYPEEFAGEIITSENGVEFNISTNPRIGFWELNIIPSEIESTEAIHTIAKFLQIGTEYLTRHFHKGQVHSYNIFFYQLKNQVYAKILPRFATPPLYIGYGVHVRPTNIKEATQEIQRLYFHK